MQYVCKTWLVLVLLVVIVIIGSGNSDVSMKSIKINDQYVTPDFSRFSWIKMGSFEETPTPIRCTATTPNEYASGIRAPDSFPSPGNTPWGLAPGNNCIWLSDIEGETIYKIDPVTGAVLTQFAAPDPWTKDLAFDGQHLWASGNMQSDIYKIDTLNGAIMSVYNSPSLNPLGLTYDGTYLWHASHPGTNTEPTQIYKIDPANGQVITSFPLPFEWANGLAYKDGHLLVSDTDLGIIYEIDPNTGEIVDAYGAARDNPLGLAYDGTNIWNVDDLFDFLFWYTPAAAPIAVAINQPRVANTYPTYQPINVIGTVQGSDLISWSVEYAEGETPGTWALIDSLHHTPKVYDTLLQWNVSGLAQNYYWVRINATCASGVDTSHQVSFHVDPDIMSGWPLECKNISPIAIADLGDGGAYEIIAGTAHNNEIECNVTVWDLSGNNVWQSPDGINNSHKPVSVGNTDCTGLYEIVTGYPTQTTGTDSCPVYVMTYNAGIYQNWPQYGIKTGYYWNTMISALSDIDLDADLEIFTGGMELHGWHHDGIAYSGAFIGSTVSDPAIGDIDCDNFDDFVFMNDSALDVRDRYGNSIAGFPVSMPAGIGASFPVIGDVDNDSVPEIILALDDMKVYVVDSEGTVLPGWPKTINGSYSNSPVVGDIDNDNDLEIIVVSGMFPQYSRVSVFEHTGNSYSGWPNQLSDRVFRYFNMPVIGDVDGDSVPEIIMGFESVSGYEELYAWNNNGDVISGWPKILTEIEGYGITGSPVLGDFDDDGNINIGVSSNVYWVGNSEIYVWDLPFPYLESTMEWPMFRHDLYRTANYHHAGEVGVVEDRSNRLISEAFGLTVYPSVSSNIVRVTTHIPSDCGTGEISIYDATGRRVYHYPHVNIGNQQAIIDFAALDKTGSNGVYFVTLRSAESTVVKKVVIVQ
ncbi:MAG: VCBS repeat-containing protein [candidate division WOR-3 bacterium]|nr:MAG: VCBS repeat-containing protein [candidate division WOR-3 bacterium]